ncbi:hypothetical protein JXA05_01280 [Candidatus Peregrinibacteria bacterium]|nr:hypothetical protein [Candidatus Peregrinibacteria bacterium]
MISRHLIITILSFFLLTSCTLTKPGAPSVPETSNPPLVGGDRDEHGCIGSAGYMWCENKGKCLRIWEEPCNEGVGDACEKDEECKMPMEYAVQSNCPFGAACLSGKCAVVCPLFYNDPEKTCQSDADCDCSWRGGKTLKCLCHAGQCLSVEAE